MKKLIPLFLTLLLLFNGGPSFAAVDCEGDPPTDEQPLQEYIESCNSKINTLKEEQQTLKSALSLINSKINLTNAQIRSTSAQISQLEEQINSLGVVISDLNIQLDQLAKVYVSRIRESYKGNKPSVITLFLQSRSFTTFQNKLKYLRIAQKRDEIILRELESARVNFDEQKTTKEEKQAEIASLKATLEAQKRVLGVQETEKNQLLAQTKNSEANYQKLRSEALARLAALRRYVVSQGGASILSNQTVCDSWGCYYNQRDSQWGNMSLGNSSYSVAEYGCLVSSVSMISTHKGISIKPSDIAAESSAFVPGSGWLLHSFQAAGHSFSLTKVGKGELDSRLEQGPVIVSLYSDEAHFIVIKAKTSEGYLMNDPFLENGNDRPLSAKYSVSDINSLRLVNIN